MKFVQLLLCLTFQSLLAQQISFDRLYEYHCERGKPACKHVVMAQSTDQRFYAIVMQKEGKTTVTVNDLQSKQFHVFNIDTTKTNLDQLETFVYQYSSDKTHESHKKYVIDFQLLAEDSVRAEYRVVHYKNKRKKSITYEYVVEIEKTSDNQFDAFRQAIMHPFEFDTDYQAPTKGKVIKSTCVVNEQKTITLLKDVSKVNALLKIPEKKILYPDSQAYKELKERYVIK